MIALYNAGKVRAIGVSNWAPQHLDDISDLMTPHVNQIEVHPFLSGGAVPPSTDLIGYCQSRNITVMSYAALGGGAGPDRDPQSTVGAAVLSDPTLESIAKAHSATIAQVVIRWHLQRGACAGCACARVASADRAAAGMIADVRSEHVPHMLDNLNGSAFTLSSDEVDKITALGDKPVRRCARKLVGR